ncbi:MAG TPA: alpha-glucan family phosphorylase [Rhodothermales bacterium]|nr:alpha-glucan family phosphorylase [Rhodothermales bacterium]
MTTLNKLEALASNLWWSWNPEVLDLFARLNPKAFHESTNNPIIPLRAPQGDFLNDAAFIRDVDTAYDALQEYLTGPRRYGDGPNTAYFCMEYGLHESLPIYSGGLGILAGDHTKAASDLGLPLTAIGLFLREGYFAQYFDREGWQRESHVILDPSNHPVTEVVGEDNQPVEISVTIGRQELRLRAWLLNVGRTNLYLLDSDFDGNPPELRKLTYRLYQGDGGTRLRQEIILGIGGIRLLRALEIEPDVYHMNEGHCAFLTLELLRERLMAGEDLADAEDWVREHCIFTTHTPVMAGHDRFDPELFVEHMAALRDDMGISGQELLAYGRVAPHDPAETFTMTVLGLKLSRQANGVSKLNGEVARRQWQHLYNAESPDEVPISHITNGIHLPTWAAPLTRAFLDQRLGNWIENRMDPEFWQRILELSDEDLWWYRNTLRKTLVDFASGYVQQQSLPQVSRLDPEALTIGFARRFATYKRAPLLFHDEERAIRLFESIDRPIQVLYSGKAHPADEGGKKFIQQIFRISQYPSLRGKLVILENYNMEIGKRLVSGCDVWLNNPRRPMEASGTSGQKVGVHGGLNVSILDGWWPEGYDGKNGWPIGTDASAEYMDPDEQDDQDAALLYNVLEREVIPAFYERDEQGIPTRWTARMRHAMAVLPYQFSAERMVADYIEQMYQPESIVR